MPKKAYGVNELREMFLSFFQTKGHLRLPSFSLVPQNDKSVLLINAGMTPMKAWFKGEEEPPCKRVATCQKCIRTGDIENVGKTARHGTYFEMLGNFSFGDYFKHEAIAWTWEFLTSDAWVGLEPDRLYPSVYTDDDEAWNIWHNEIGIPEDRIFRFGKEDNFWEHGSGPCGPCSEVYYDRGEEYGCGKPGCTVGCDCDRYIEIWNNVFTQFDNDGHNNYTELAQKNIDTGMGLERLAVVCQQVNSLFDIDTVMHITHKVSELTGAFYGQSFQRDVSLRVITDHIRAAVFMISDGILPSNEGRGYVLRRLLRRAARHGKLLGVNEPFLHRIVDTVIHENECEYPDLRERQEYITKVVYNEEASFAKTIDGGMKIFAEMLAAHKAGGETVFAGADAFKLYDTYGFPVDLTIEMAQDEGMTVDEQSFQQLMQEQKVRAREARKALGDLGWAGVEFGKDIPSTRFVGYDCTEADGKLVAIVADDELREEIGQGAEAIIVLDQTPMYAEMGGQVADHGRIMSSAGVFEVTDVQKNKGGKYMHYGRVLSGTFTVGDVCTCKIDADRRQAIRRAHSATHLLQKALTQVLGDHVHQSGSLVEPDRLRFDFTHFSAMTAEELSRVSLLLNESVLAGYSIKTEELPIEEARNRGAVALFGEKYGDIVRVVDMGDGYSIEFCGGTHLRSTAQIGSVRILSESSVAAGVRRIEAITGKAVLAQTDAYFETICKTAETLKANNPNDLLHRAETVMKELRDNRQLAEKLKDQMLAARSDSLLAQARPIGSLKVLTARMDADTAELRKTGDLLREKDESIVAVLAGTNGEKISFFAVCGKQAVKAGVKAGDLMKEICRAAGGSGGGKPDSAMGGGKEPGKVDQALGTADALVSRALGL